MDAIKLWLKQAWIWIVAALSFIFLIWLRFIHDPQLRREGALKHRRDTLDKRVEAYEKSKKDTKEKEDRLRQRIEETNKEIEKIERDTPSADDAAEHLRDWLSSDED